MTLINRRRSPVPGALLGVLVLLCLGGCTASALYSRVDTLAGWYIGSLVSLDDEQRSQVQQWLTETLEWHRSSELNRYATFLRDLAIRSAAPAPLAAHEQALQRAEGFWDDLLQQAAPQASVLLRELSPAQVEELIGNIDEQNRERAAEKEKDTEVWRRDQQKSLTRFVKRWTGTITGTQKELIEATCATIEPTRSEWLENQQSWTRALEAALAAGDTARVGDLLRYPRRQWTAEYLQKEQANRQRYLEFAVQLDASLTGAQRAHLQRDLHKLADKLDAIAVPG